MRSENRTLSSNSTPGCPHPLHLNIEEVSGSRPCAHCMGWVKGVDSEDYEIGAALRKQPAPRQQERWS